MAFSNMCLVGEKKKKTSSTGMQRNKAGKVVMVLFQKCYAEISYLIEIERTRQIQTSTSTIL